MPLLTVLALMLLLSDQTSGETLLARDHGVIVGILEPGPNNAITDVAGVRVGYETIVRDESINTGVTVVMPPGDDMSPLFQAVIEATEEAIHNSLFAATTVRGHRGTVEAMPREATLEYWSATES